MKRIAFSFDDVPNEPGGFFTPGQRTETLVRNMALADIKQAAFFVVTGGFHEPRGVGGEERTKAYTAAGHVLGSHSHSHPALSNTSVDAYLADIDRAADWLDSQDGKRPWFRFPYLDEGDSDLAKRSAVRTALHNRGYVNAYVTVLTFDWLLDTLAGAAANEVDMTALRDLYVESLLAPAEFYERIAVQALGRSPVHVILLHENDLNALFIADAAGAFRASGWDIVTMDEAYQDPIASQEPKEWCGSGRVAGLVLDSKRPIECPLIDAAAVRRSFQTRVLGRS